ncbi:MAG: hypothetical protein JRD88_09360 [Deltaproteobacteria bacterium]|nr:hypothetical protein [Deltaproteobacteria bacterium]
MTLDGVFEFAKPEGYKMFRDLGDGETIFMFFKEEGEFPSQTSFFYNDKVYGNALELETRINQFFKYFLVGRGVKMEINKIEDGMIDGRNALLVYSSGENPYRNEKVKAMGYFYKLGQYIVSLACTQWRTMDGEFDQKRFQEFETFANSFKYLKKPFYEEVEARINELK